MKKSIVLFAFVYFTNLLFCSSILGQTAAPTPNPEFLYYCLNESAAALSATTSGGGTLRWYTAETTGGFSTTAPTPPTNVAASGRNVLIYYVTQIISGVESTPRTPIYVYVDQKLDLFCDTVTTNSIKFDFANTGQSSFSYSYTIDGGTPITGNFNSPSNFTVSGLGEGQTVSFTLTPVGAKSCVTTENVSCKTFCSPANIRTPDFAAIAPICSGSTPAPTLAPMSPNNISGTWSPALVSNTATGDYVFTPDPVAFPCATNQTLTVTVIPLVTPTFATIPASVCQNSTAPILPSNSSNSTAISGTWSPTTVDTSGPGPSDYVFTPNAGQCVSSPTTTVTITVDPNLTPSFTQVPPICSGATLAALPTTSNNGITGTWSPALNNTATTNYAFTPTAGQCATTTTMTITVTPIGTPTFTAVSPICNGDSLSSLPTTSNNGYTGTWSPALDNTVTTTYTFTPGAGECATATNLTITVNQLIAVNFSSIPRSVCRNSTAPTLPPSSSNSTPVNGTWSPATVNTSVPGPSDYVFTPNSGQCVSSPTTTVTITVDPNVTPSFTAVAPICSGAPLSALPTTSNNGITGTWSPALNNTATTTYTFTPTIGQCATNATITISVTANGTPTFTAVAPICTGDPLAPLPTTSNNGYTGTWSPTVDNTATTTYTFSPDAGQCATTANLVITVNQLRTPNFVNVPRNVCENEIATPLPSSSSNSSPISGTWSPASVDTAVVGTNDYVFTPDAGQCSDTVTIPITVSPSNTLVNFQWTVTEAFSENQVITITATAAGDYLYQLDDGPFQESPVFEYVSPGSHSVTVSDVTGCSASITKNNILVIGYPRFFTPNNDGYNDFWNVFTLVDRPGSKIQIFDRYGKLLKEITPNGTGWSGMYNGQALPATDYWFVVDYPEDGVIKKFRSHFSLKR
jgi:gliding motility-associated-like protein